MRFTKPLYKDYPLGTVLSRVTICEKDGKLYKVHGWDMDAVKVIADAAGAKMLYSFCVCKKFK